MGITYYGKVTPMIDADAPLREPLWQGPYHPTWHMLVPGTWLIWAMPDFVKIGRLDHKQGISLVIEFEGHPVPTVVPDAYQYWEPDPLAELAPYMLRITTPPKHRVAPATGDFLSVRQVAALLGCGPKDVRRMLRSGKLEGRQKEGSWAGVTTASVERLSRGASLGTG